MGYRNANLRNLDFGHASRPAADQRDHAGDQPITTDAIGQAVEYHEMVESVSADGEYASELGPDRDWISKKIAERVVLLLVEQGSDQPMTPTPYTTGDAARFRRGARNGLVLMSLVWLVAIACATLAWHVHPLVGIASGLLGAAFTLHGLVERGIAASRAAA